ncbi:MAG: hypothetical protein VB061_08440 [Christensenella sp.]|nr:hypothetical protein [Christensenella sp.]
MQKAKYRVLLALINDRGIRKSVIARRLDISPKTLYGKLRGKTGFIFEEARIIHEEFFPDVPLERLFSVSEGDYTA